MQPHQMTFNWIFENSDLGLVQWLRKGSGIYWIQGKPGSGKSTLMKFLHNSPRTSEILTRWRQGRGQMSTWFFFNERGSYIEKSFEGLFRSIIRALISANEQLAELVLEVYLDRVKQTSKQKQKQKQEQTWHVQDLEYALSAILSQRQQELDVLLFLDALDEYSGPPEMIAEFVQSLVQTTTDSKTKLKVLFSSRPWDAFVASFGRCPGFKMHEQTESDMRVFVLDQLSAIPTATPSLPPQNVSVDSPSRDIVSTFVDRAEGVFLWVKLVTESLVEAGPNATTLQLERLLQALPDGLEELYERTIERIPGSSRLEVFIVIEIVNRTSEPMTVLEIVLAASCALSKTFQDCVDATRKRLSGMDFQQEALRLKNLRGGLIDAGHSSADSTVQFMHQTVKDFVNRPGFEHRMLGCSHAPLYQNGFSFLFKYELAMSHIARSSSQNHLPPRILQRQAAEGSSRVINILRYVPILAHLAEGTTGNNQETFLDSIGDSGIRSLIGSPEMASRILLEAFFRCSIVPDSVLSFAVYGGLLLYTRQKLRNTDISKDSPRNSLLHIAVETSISLELRAPSMIELLLNNRANIHHMLDGETPFQHLMATARHIHQGSHGFWSRLSKDVEVFLKHGQDANVDIPHGPSESLGGTSKIFSKPLHIALGEVSKTLLEHGAHVNALDSDGWTALDRLYREMPEFAGETYLVTDEMHLVTGSILLEHGGCITHSTENLLPDILYWLGSSGVDIPEALRNPPRLQGWLARRLRGLVPTFLGGK
jgi:hypothetical protein